MSHNLFPLQDSELTTMVDGSHMNGLTWPRLFGEGLPAQAGDPYDAITWERRDARITKGDGTVVFEQKDIEVPSFWSQTAIDIVASKYFRGKLGTPERESSVRQMVDRVADTIAGWGFKDGTFATAQDYENFKYDLKFLLVNQYAAFNSPVWFNVGVYERPQCSACFILAVEDSMQSILDWYRDEGWIFKYGSGSGTNLSKLRSSKEMLSRGGRSSGPVSFMKGADGVANSIRSGGTTRRAAKMVVLNADHPDIKDFIYCKKNIEEMTRILEASGIKNSIEGDLFDPYTLLPYQNANNSVRVTDEFMKTVEENRDWNLTAVTDGHVIETRKASEIMGWIADAAWHSADPGMQYDTTINDWNTVSNTGRINASNPCFTGDALVYTDRGLLTFEELHRRFNEGEKISVYTHNLTNKETPTNTISLTVPTRVVTTGTNPIYKLSFSNGVEVKATANHRFFTKNRGYVEAKNLKKTDEVMLLDQEVAFDQSNLTITVDEHKIYASGWGGRNTRQFKEIKLPKVWTSPFAEYVGYLVGDGSIVESTDADHRLSTASLVLGSEAEIDELLPRFKAMLEYELGAATQTVEMPNGTVQLRVNRTPFVRFMKQLGVSDQRAHLKHVPFTVFQAPKHIIAAFLRGLFSADGCVYNDYNSRYVGLGSVSKNLLLEVQQLLLSFGIYSKIYETRTPRVAFSYTTKTGKLKHYLGKQLFDLRIAGKSILAFRDQIGFLNSYKQEKLQGLIEKHVFYNIDYAGVSLESKEYLGEELTYNLTEPTNHSYMVNGIAVANCSEYMHLDNSACNLASINLLKFLRGDGSFDIELYRHAITAIITAQEIIVGNSSYPTQKITDNAIAFRELGLGYANLGALLMSFGLPYDSDEGRAITGALTSILSGTAYAQSARIAAITGPFAGYAVNSEPMLRVIEKHGAAAEELAARAVTGNGHFAPAELFQTSVKVWQEALELGRRYGYRNSQATVLAPTGTIAFLMDCGTTGIEPELALVKYKKLVGGGTLKLVNTQVPAALRTLGYTDVQIADISAYILEKETIEGAPHIREEHMAVFDCSFKAQHGTRSISYQGHIKMMGAAQPFISGAISKTVNLPTEATADDIRNVFIESWKLGLKAVAVYRDGSKSVQPMSTTDKDKKLVEHANGYTRIKLPDERPSLTHKFSVGNHEGYLHIGMYPETKKPGELFVTIAKEGSTISGLLDVVATLVSMCLQSGVPLKVLVRKFKDMRFEPSGATMNSEIPFTKSFMDYIFRYLGMKFLNEKDREEIFGSTEPEAIATTPSVPLIDKGEGALDAYTDAPLCSDCGTMMLRAGSCFSCPNCFATTGVCN